MSLPGEGFIALWNDIAPSREDYDTWHTIEHVPERMTVEGFLRAHRYVLIVGSQPKYFTLYALRELAALSSDAYLRIVNEPTAWSRGMRPDMRNFIRRICRTRVSQGGGVGGFAAIGLSTSSDVADARALCDRLSGMDGISGTHFGTIDGQAKSLPITVAQGTPPFEPSGLFIIEGYDEHALAASCRAVGDTLVPAEGWSFYKLAFELSKSDLQDSSFPEAARLQSNQPARGS